MRRIIATLVAIDLAVAVTVLFLWFVNERQQERSNVVNPGLRGSRPPAGQRTLDLSRIDDVRPPVPSPDDAWDGRPLLLITTCLECRSGELVGGFLRLLTARELPQGTNVVVVGWGGDAAAWRRAYRLGDSVDLHAATTEAAAARVRARARVRETGFAYVSDPRGRWRSTFTASTLQVDDVVHDLEALS